jgi:hypothetical protein
MGLRVKHVVILEGERERMYELLRPKYYVVFLFLVMFHIYRLTVMILLLS